jgi:hypothetical protein
MVGSFLVSLGLMGGAMEREETEPRFGRTLFNSVVGSILGYVGLQKLMREDYGTDEAGPDSLFAAVMGAGMAVGGWVGHKIACGGTVSGSWGCKLLEFAGMIGGMWGVMQLLEKGRAAG